MSCRLQILVLCLAFAAGAVPAGAQGSNAPATAGRAEVIRPDADENLQWAAAVVQLNTLRNQGGEAVKLFGTAGGDPAMNGLYTYLAFFESTGDGWRVFRLGDFLSYRILSESRGRLLLGIGESTMDERTIRIGARTRRLLVTWRAGTAGEPPAFVSVIAVR